MLSRLPYLSSQTGSLSISMTSQVPSCLKAFAQTIHFACNIVLLANYHVLRLDLNVTSSWKPLLTFSLHSPPPKLGYIILPSHYTLHSSSVVFTR